MNVVRARAAEVGAPLRTFEGDYRLESGGTPDAALVLVGEDGFRVRCGLAVPGEAARTNAALAIACVRALGVHSDEALLRACRTGLAGCRLPGRVEQLLEDPRVIVDSAHTARSISSLADSLESLAPGGFDLVLSVSADKALEDVLAPLLDAPGRRRVVATRAEPTRSLPADVLAQRIAEAAARKGIDTSELDLRVVPDPSQAVAGARSRLDPGRMLCVTGSVYLAGVARRALGTRSSG